MKPPEYLYLIDGHSLFYQCYHGIGMNLHSPEGEPTKGTYGFTRKLVKLCTMIQPSYLAVALDGPKHELVRRQWYAEYKDKRHDKPDDVKIQLARIRDVCKALGVTTVQVKGWEADDVIATLARGCVSDEVHVCIASGDHDLYQLLDDPRITIVDSDGGTFLTGKELKLQKGYGPERVVDIKTLAGCGTDNVPGVKGVGEDTAIKLLKTYGSIQDIIVACSMRHGMVKGKIGENLVRAHADGTLKLCRKLVRLNDRLDLSGYDLKLEFNGLNFKAAGPLFRRLGFRSLE